MSSVSVLRLIAPITSAGTVIIQKARIVAGFAGFEMSAGVSYGEPTIVLETAHGTLSGSTAILRFIARARSDHWLLGKGSWECAQVDQWIDFTTNEIERLLTSSSHHKPQSKTGHSIKAEYEQTLTILNDHLSKSTFMVGGHLTLADISLAVALHPVFTSTTNRDAHIRKQFLHLTRWYQLIASQKQFADVMTPVSSATVEGAAAAGSGGSDTKSKSKPKAVGSGRHKLINLSGEREKESDDSESPVQPERKSNPLDLLPESPMSLTTIKQKFFAARPQTVQFWRELFWPQFDSSGFSFWCANYKYSAENTVIFKTMGMISGWTQRAEACRPYAMGVVNICAIDEDTPPYAIQSVWLFRGSEVIQEMLDVDDSQWFDWTKLDTAKRETRAWIENMFVGDSAGSKPADRVVERRYFK